MAITKRTRKDGGASYQVVVDVRDAGRRKQTVVGTFRTKKEAVKAERNALDQIDKGRFVHRTSTTVAELIAHWIALTLGLWMMYDGDNDMAEKKVHPILVLLQSMAVSVLVLVVIAVLLSNPKLWNALSMGQR